MKNAESSESRDCRPLADGPSEESRRAFFRFVGLGTLALLTAPLCPEAASADGPVNARPKYYGAFSELPVGTVTPQGWIKKWLERQAEGLSGQPENMAYPYDTCMFAGVIPPPRVRHGQDWWPYEQSGYFFDAIARLNQLIDDDATKRRHAAMLDYILDHSTPYGFGASQWGWPNAVVGRGLLADYSATGNEKIAALLHQYLVTNAPPMGRDGVNAEEAWTLYGLTGDPRLLAYAQQVYDGYTGEGSFCSMDKIVGLLPFKSHGVTAAEYLKMLPLLYLYTGNPQALELTKQAYDKVIANNLMPDGGIVSQESLAATVFNSLHESCDITDWSWSIGYCLMATGDPKWADLIERATFNALPGAVTKDFKQAQYFSAANQILTTSLSNHGSNACTRMSYRAAHDTQCCVGNINRAMPNYVIRQWMKTPNDGLAALFYGPSEVKTTLQGQPVTLTQDTDYPFREDITFRIQTEKSVTFDLQLRIPGWCSEARITVNDQAFTGKTEADSFAIISREFRNKDTIRLTLPMKVRLEEWLHGESGVLARGPLIFSLKIAEKRVELTRDTPYVAAALKGNWIQGIPAVEFYPQSEWRYGIDADLKDHLDSIKVVESRMSDNPFRSDHAPVHLKLALRRLPEWFPNWTAEPPPPPPSSQPGEKPVMVKSPGTLPIAEEKQNAEAATTMVMIPYGATHLRLTTLPFIST